MFSRDKDISSKCPDYYDGLFTSNLINTIQGIMRTLDILIGEWEKQRETEEGMKQFFKKRRFETMFSDIDGILSSIYYWVSLESSQLMVKELENESNLVGSVVVLIYILIAGSAFGFYALVTRTVQEKMVSFYSILFALPCSIIETNLALTHHLNSMHKGKSLY